MSNELERRLAIHFIETKPLILPGATRNTMVRSDGCFIPMYEYKPLVDYVRNIVNIVKDYETERTIRK